MRGVSWNDPSKPSNLWLPLEGIPRFIPFLIPIAPARHYFAYSAPDPGKSNLACSKITARLALLTPHVTLEHVSTGSLLNQTAKQMKCTKRYMPAKPTTPTPSPMQTRKHMNAHHLQYTSHMHGTHGVQHNMPIHPIHVMIKCSPLFPPQTKTCPILWVFCVVRRETCIKPSPIEWYSPPKLQSSRVDIRQVAQEAGGVAVVPQVVPKALAVLLRLHPRHLQEVCDVLL